MDTNKPDKDFLLHMYDQMWNNINRHILGVWQSIAVIGAIISIFIFSKDFILGFDIAISLIMILSAWLISHVYDAQAWFDRNISIIQKIEMNFIDPEKYHGYRGARPLKLIEHLRIQRDIAILFVVISVCYHVWIRVVPMLVCNKLFEWKILMPYVFFAVGVGYVNCMRREWHKVYMKSYSNI